MSAELLPMVLDIEVRRHKRELSESFAKLREELTPPPAPETPMQRWAQAVQNAGLNAYTQRLLQMQMASNQYKLASLAPDSLALSGLAAMSSPHGPNWLRAPNSAF